ncbi:MAG: penicillin-binding protein 2 [Rhodospirillales bacterium]|nr:penicillin-binding protein 2 [Rhodospirillales bacterium]
MTMIAIAFVVVGLRLGEVALSGETDAGTLHPAEEAPFRGEVFDRHGTMLATTVLVPSIWVNPSDVRDPAALAEELTAVFPELDQADLARRLAADKRRNRQFLWIRRHAPPSRAEAAMRIGSPGLYIQEERRRVYPQGRLTSHVVGYVNIDGDPQAGIERVGDRSIRKGPLQLTLDVGVQNVLRNRLQAAMEKFQAVAAAGVVLEIDSGDVLAQVSLPDFDPNDVRNVDDSGMLDLGTQGVFEMGSTFKTFTVAAALDAGKASVNSNFDATEPIKIGRYTINDYHPEERWLRLSEVFVHSSNIGMVRVAEALGEEQHWDYLGRLGLLSDIDGSGLRTSHPRLPDAWGKVQRATVSYGHGIAVSPMHLAAAVAAVVGDGQYRVPRLLRSGSHEPSTAAFRPSTVRQMRMLLRQVVLHGTAGLSDVGNYEIGGKTGTAQKVVDGRYRRGARTNSFVAAFPMSAPRYVVVVLLDEPKAAPGTHGFATAGWNVAPLAGSVVAGVAPLLGVPPVPVEPPARDAVTQVALR